MESHKPSSQRRPVYGTVGMANGKMCTCTDQDPGVQIHLVASSSVLRGTRMTPPCLGTQLDAPPSMLPPPHHPQLPLSPSGIRPAVMACWLAVGGSHDRGLAWFEFSLLPCNGQPLRCGKRALGTTKCHSMLQTATRATDYQPGGP